MRDLSTPQAEVVRATIDRVLKVYEGRRGVEVAVTLGVVESYVTKLRTGWRPTRVREDLWRRLLEHDPARAPETPQPAAFYDGVLFAAQAMSETVTRLLAEARAGLSARPVSPTAGEVAEGLAAMEAAGVLERPGQGKKKKAQS